MVYCGGNLWEKWRCVGKEGRHEGCLVVKIVYKMCDPPVVDVFYTFNIESMGESYRDAYCLKLESKT